MRDFLLASESALDGRLGPSGLSVGTASVCRRCCGVREKLPRGSPGVPANVAARTGSVLGDGGTILGAGLRGYCFGVVSNNIMRDQGKGSDEGSPSLPIAGVGGSVKPASRGYSKANGVRLGEGGELGVR